MTNLISVIRTEIEKLISDTLKIAQEKNNMIIPEKLEFLVEIPKENGHGDFSTNVSMLLAKSNRCAPRKIADILLNLIAEVKNNYKISINKIECAGAGFLNFYLNKEWLYEVLELIGVEKDEYGFSNIGNGKKVMVEFVSANPTGPLHMGNARGGALGDLIASVLSATGYDVTKEFYINDAGNQIEKFGLSLEARYMQEILGRENVEFPEDGYQGEDILDHAKEYIKINGNKLMEVSSDIRRKELVDYALPINIERIKSGLELYGVEFDNWFSEKSLYESGELQETIDLLTNKGFTYKKEDAIWFKSTEFGSDKDDVLVRNNGIPTYLAADIAYHRNKLIKRNYDWVINLWGADHHGHIARMKGAISAIGEDPEKLNVVIFQLVRLLRNGEVARMSKRTGKSISLTDLLEEIDLGNDNPNSGKDVARFIFNTKASGSHLDFDLDIAVQQSNDNPVYYVQYAHTRICSIIRRVKEDRNIDIPELCDINTKLLTTDIEMEVLRKLAMYPEEIVISAKTLEPSRITRYSRELAKMVHSFFEECNVKNSETELAKARLYLINCVKIVLKNSLELLKITAPEEMKRND